MKHLYLFICFFTLLISCKEEEEKLKPKICFDYSPKGVIRVGDTVYFSNCSENSERYIWDFGYGDTSIEANPFHVFCDTGTFFVRLTSQNFKNTDTLCVPFHIYPIEVKTCFNYLPKEIKVDDTVLFFNCSENANKYSWDFGDGDTTSIKNPLHVFKKAGTYIISLKTYNEFSTDSISITLRILPKPDNIFYYKFEPYISINSVRQFEKPQSPVCYDDIAVPDDSSTSISIDINNDKIEDFEFIASHKKYYPDKYCGHCSAFYEYQISINQLLTSDSVCRSNIFFNVKLFSYGDSIVNKEVFDTGGTIGINIPCVISFGFSSMDAYVGFKNNVNYGWIHIAPISNNYYLNNGIIIKEFAINLTDDNPIRAGQKE
jgi:hypothetical protein